MDDLDLLFLGAHRDPAAEAQIQDAMRAVRERRLPRHRARRPLWKPPPADPELQAIEAKHAHDGQALVR